MRLDSALTTYDAQIANATPSSHVRARRSFGAALVAPTPTDHWETQTLAGLRPFYLVHAMMAFAAAGRTTTVWRMLEALPHTSESSTLSVPEDALVEPFCEALLAFVREDYAACVEWLTRVPFAWDKRKTNESDCSRDRNLESIRKLASLLPPDRIPAVIGTYRSRPSQSASVTQQRNRP